MKTRSVGTSIWLLIFGAAAILLIGAFARFDTSGGEHGNQSGAMASPLAVALEPGDAAEPAGGPGLPANLSPGLDEIIKLAQAHVGNDVLLAYVRNSGRTYNPSADEILYLTDLGISQTVIAALYARNPADTAVATASAASPPQPPGFSPAPSSELPVKTVSANAESAFTAGSPRDGLISPPLAAVDSQLAQEDATRSTQHDAPPPASDFQPLQDPTSSFFYDGLAPYGSWVDLGQQGWFWQPTVGTTVIGWQPYRDHGSWAYTDSGWFWRSDYSWGWAAFHYGRWLNHPRYGWVWNPGSTWAPAWVAWRNTPQYAGWAPLPPGAPLNFGVGLAVNPLSLELGFGLSASAFTFVRYDDFTSLGVDGFAAPSSVVAGLVRASTPVNNYVTSGGKVLNLGVSSDQIAAATHEPVKRFSLRDVSSAGSANRRMRGGALTVYRPAISDNAAQYALNNTDSRLSQPGQGADPAVPTRDIHARSDDAFASGVDNRFGTDLPRTPPPDAPGWTTRKFSLSSGANPATPFFRGYEPPANRAPAYEEPSSGQRFYNNDARATQDRPVAAESRGASSTTSSSKK